MYAASTVAMRGPTRIGRILHSNTYTIFILVLTIYSLAIMVVQFLLPQGTETWKLVNLIDNLICIIFLVDFAMHMINEPVKRNYFIGERGYLDLLGSVPSFGFFQYTALLRLFRLSRLARLRRILNPENRKLLRKEILENRGSYALFITILLAAVVLITSSILVLYFETSAPADLDTNIDTGGDALWWSTVTITTVGYGDYYPKTTGGRLTAVFVMVGGLGIIGALASILASILVPQPKEIEEEVEDTGEHPVPPPTPMELELAQIKNELASLRHLLEKNGASEKEGGG